VNARYFAREPVAAGQYLGTGFIALTSMFWRDDAPNEAHDADRFVIDFSDGRQDSQQLSNPEAPQANQPLWHITPFAVSEYTLSRFALVQLDREATHYASYASAEYARRVNVAVEEIRSSKAFAIELGVSHTTYEGHDNVNAIMTLTDRVVHGEPICVSYTVRAWLP
jgi:glucan biosynthesis protein